MIAVGGIVEGTDGSIFNTMRLRQMVGLPVYFLVWSHPTIKANDQQLPDTRSVVLINRGRLELNDKLQTCNTAMHHCLVGTMLTGFDCLSGIDSFRSSRSSICSTARPHRNDRWNEVDKSQRQFITGQSLELFFDDLDQRKGRNNSFTGSYLPFKLDRGRSMLDHIIVPGLR
jgi:hypothetical protein